jgi:hypothetical protein
LGGEKTIACVYNTEAAEEEKKEKQQTEDTRWVELLSTLKDLGLVLEEEVRGYLRRVGDDDTEEEEEERQTKEIDEGLDTLIASVKKLREQSEAIARELGGGCCLGGGLPAPAEKGEVEETKIKVVKRRLEKIR